MIRLRLKDSVVLVALATGSLWAKQVPVSVRAVRDGTAATAAWSGSDKALVVSGSSQPSEAWMEFDAAPDTSAATTTLELLVRSVTQSGTLEVFALTGPITSLENATQPRDLPTSRPVPIGRIPLVAGTSEQLVRISLSNATGAVPSGLVLSSHDGLVARIASKESDVPAVLVSLLDVVDSIPQGFQGAKGDSGLAGMAGTQGPKGDSGPQGPQGIQGPMGLQGPDGTPGLMGAMGAPGPIGLQGATGAPGPMGLTGPKGLLGPQGLQGIQGATGPQGYGYGSLGIAPSSLTSLLGRVGKDTIQFAVVSGWNKFKLGDSVRVASTLSPTVWLHGRVVAYDSTTGAGRLKPTWALDTTTTKIPATPTATTQWRVTALARGLFLEGLAQVNDTLMLAPNPSGGAAPVAGQLLSWDGNNWVPKTLTKTSSVGGNQPFGILNPYLGMNYVISLFGIYPSQSGGQPYIGEIDLVGFNFAPSGWAFCNGQILSIADYSTLFNLIGTTYGGDGVTTFGLPDLQGRFAVHQGAGVIIGQKSGSPTHTLGISEMPIHNHAIQ